MKVGIDSYCFHRFFGEVYNYEEHAAVRQSIAELRRITNGLS